MSEVDYEKLEKSLENLTEQYENYLTIDEQGLSEVNKKAVKNSVIKCFEICYDTLWKHLKRYLENQGLPDVPSSPKPLFRVAHKNRLIENLENWIDKDEGYYQARIDTTHDYSMEKSEKVLRKIGNFIQDATELCQEMTEET